MNTIIKNFIILGVFAGFVFASVNCIGMDVKQRAAIIKGLKLKGIIGENNKGFIEFRTGDKSASAIVNEENSERRKAYTEIARKTGSSVDAVGAQRAIQIAGEEPNGIWIQDSSGKWYKK